MSTGGVGSRNLDTRLLRYRTRRGEENAVALVEDLLAAGRGQDAQEVVAAALKAQPEDADLLVADGRARFATGDLLGAQASLLKAARANPKSKTPFRWLGEVLLKRGDPARASKVLQRARAIDAADPTVRRLLERAQRLQRVADSASEEAAAPEAPETPEERTVIRSDLTEQLATMTREVDEDANPPYDAVDEEATTGLSPKVPPAATDDFEDEPTNVVDGAALEREARARRAAPPAPEKKDLPPPRKRRVKRTLAFGSPDAPDDLPAAPPPPGRTPGVGKARVGKAGAGGAKAAAPPAKPPTSTSPGAAAAPIPPPPKRSL
ncbi:MAG TPA: tetratricopeptide repeat protein, partial [Sandaracinaceae bacterium LLY-WYZ-13_1]|nr:tetratricopeptide repeat protein [Sandaracinaceae bacterium LLY-WYZ-13_1]